MSGESFTLWFIRVSAVLYVVAVAAWCVHRDRAARAAWTAAWLFYAVHVAAAFQFYHAWSHARAYEATARQTNETVGVNWGGGLWINYLFTVIWLADALWWRRGLADYRHRPAWIGRAVHIFLAFMFFNATVVFGHGAIRWWGVAGTVLLGAVYLFGKRASVPI